MNLDARTLLFSLILTNAMMVLSLLAATSRGQVAGERDGIGKWATAILLETLAWMLVAARGAIPDMFSVVIANGFLAGAFALMLAAIGEFQQRSLPRWQYIVPIVLSLMMATILIGDIRSRFIWGGMVYILQMVLIARALLSDRKTRNGRAWRLLLGGIAVIVMVLALRAIVALSGEAILEQPKLGGVPNWIQIVSFIALMATSLLGSIGYLLMVKERSDWAVMHLAMTDSLTGISNRRALIEHIERVLSQRSGRPMALLMIDVDHFKRINDTHGHPVGDEVLIQFASLLKGRLRGGDLLGRYGGEEFCVVALDIDANGAMTLADSLREIVASTVFSAARGDMAVTVSIGVAHCPAADAARELKEILAEADVALYTAKAKGRNQVVCLS